MLKHSLGVFPFLLVGVRRLSLLAEGGVYPSRHSSQVSQSVGLALVTVVDSS